MQIVKPQAILLAITPNAEQLIERCGRVCYKSEAKITPESAGPFIEMLIRRGHHSVLEHASATIHFVCDRGVTHELVRHRLASFSQESTRYCDYGADRFGAELSFIEPPGLGAEREAWVRACTALERRYLRMVGNNVKPQIARAILPNCLKAEIAVTANLREWRHIFDLRLSPAAHPQMREVMAMAFELLRVECPNVFPVRGER